MGRSTSVKVARTRPNYGIEYRPTPADLETVRNLTLLGCTQEIIANCVGTNGISVPTLRKNFADVLERHRYITLGRIANGTLYQKALPRPGKNKGDPDEPGDSACAMFIMKCRAGWRETDPAMNINANQVQVVKRVIGISEDDI